MSSVNKVILVGHLGAEPETRHMPDGNPVCNLRLATSDKWKDKNSGEQREATEWHRVVLYRKLAETASTYLHKGSCIYVEGRLRTREWQDKDGRDRYTTEIEASAMQMIGKSGASIDEKKSPGYAPVRMGAASPTVFAIEDSDIPF